MELPADEWVTKQKFHTNRSFTKKNLGRKGRRQAAMKTGSMHPHPAGYCTDTELGYGTNRIEMELPGDECEMIKINLPEDEWDMLDRYSKLDKSGWLDVLHSERNKVQVNNILSLVERMRCNYGMSCDVASSNDKILRKVEEEIGTLVDSQSLLRECDKEGWLVERLRELGEKMSSFVEYVLRECDKGGCWRTSICYPLPHDSFNKEKPILLRKLIAVENAVTPALDFGLRGIKDGNVVGAFDGVLPLLSMGNLVLQTSDEQIVVQPDFRHKYVLVFCINAPVLFGTEGCQSLINLCKELSKRGDIDVEMVMVARMNILADTVKVFDHLLSGFPSCLAVPYDDWKRREQLWKLLDCKNAHLIKCFSFDGAGVFLNSFCVCDYSFPYGAEAFPFTETVMRDVAVKRRQLRHCKLPELLRPYEYAPDVVVYDVDDRLQEKGKKISEVIIGKHVGVYLCCEGSLIPDLRYLYQQCKEEEKEFEIVMLYLPSISKICPLIFKDIIDGMLQKERICGWWVLPFNNSVSLRFWGLTMDYDCNCGSGSEKWEDKLIIIGSDGKILDMYGGVVVRWCNEIHDIYPFTRAALLDKKVKEVRDLSLLSLLDGQNLFRGNDPCDTITFRADMFLMRKKKIIIFMGVLNEYKTNVDGYTFFQGLKDHYKEKNGEFEVVFLEFPAEEEIQVTGDDACDSEGEIQVVTRDDACDAEGEIQLVTRDDGRDLAFGGMPWYHCPLEGTYTPLAKRLKELFWDPSLVGFGEDGKIYSVKQVQSDYDDPAIFNLEDTLEQDVCYRHQFDYYRKI